jgi:hypothetical protein
VAEDGRVVLTNAEKPKPASRFEKLRGLLGRGMSTDEIMAMLRD